MATAMDLLLHLPHRYQDRTRIVPLRALRVGQECLVQGQVTDSRIIRGRRRNWLVVLNDGEGALTLRFFHFSQRQVENLKIGRTARCFGEVRAGPTGMEMAHPEYRDYAEPPTELEARLTPVYPTTKGLGQTRLRALVAQVRALDWPQGSALPLESLFFLHLPAAGATDDDIAQAQERIARDELTAYYLVMRFRQSQRQSQQAPPLPQAQQLGRTLLEHLGFQLTRAQRRVVREVLLDLAQSRPMLRLLQGDVGSGKTVVAAFAAIRAAEHQAQTALMAPTEILAEQHYLSFSSWLTPLGIPVAMLTGGQSKATRQRTLDGLASGETLVAVGTHALFQQATAFDNLALTIVDEQHRFGVHQRMALRAKGRTPHQLIMTATPIPRTLTMALYADMDVSLLDELPPGRQPIDTRLVAASRRDEVLARIAKVLDAGQQAYWVCTLIEDSDQLYAESAETTWQRLRAQLPGRRIGLIHGRMKSEEKAAVMAAFKAGDHQLLVATTVIEVGVDVPNASLMVIENPERLGLAQLHQLRGRIGRGTRKSYCILLYGTPLGDVSRARLKVIRESQDGFHIAEQDLALRGPGEILGTRQTGETRFRVADLARHAHLIPEIIQEGQRLLTEAPEEAEALRLAWAGGDVGPVSV
ncbi:MAG: ATP-dependent DNA helicase RecG [Gammaproteobacteria bacterium]|nr:ATP-dependent DNA helicase RecG [Gammaproteobacteria bacterium]MYE51359.1 ATP-dependent DNA helicase RecG [Gammaproteobacteria bacterium]MYF50418.1 ATP-dependent DNA helicase RecG [Gammaproteobacteria bacterium]